MPLTADVPLDEVVYFDFITSRFDTGAATDADSTPTFEVFEEATDTDIGVGGNATKRTSKTGNYRVSFTCSAANGFELGKWYSVVASATVNSVAGKGVIGTFRIVAAETTAGYPLADVHAIAANAITATSIATDAITAAKVAADAIGASELAADAATEIANAVKAALLATVVSGVAQGDGSGTDTLQLASGAVSSDDQFNGYIMAIVAGAGKGQQRQILDTIDATDVIQVVGGDWETAVDNTSVYVLFAN